MGILNRRDVFTSKYVTALILDSSNRAWFVPIKATINDYFICDLDKQLYIFRIEGSRIFTYRHTLSKSFALIVYSTKHYMPLSGEVNELRKILKAHSLPRVGNSLLSMLKVFATREKADMDGNLLEPHSITQFVNELANSPRYKEQAVHNLVAFMQNLAADKIVMPIRSVAEFLDADLMATDPKYLGLIAQTLNTNLEEQRKLANKPVTGKGPMMKIVAIGTILACIGAVGFILLGDGGNVSVLDGLGGGLGGQTQAEKVADLTSQYSPDELIAAIQSGEVREQDVPNDVLQFLRQHAEETARLEAQQAQEQALATESLEDALGAAIEGAPAGTEESEFMDALQSALPGITLPDIELPDPPASLTGNATNSTVVPDG